MFWYLFNICIIILAWIWPVRNGLFLTQARIMQIRNKRTCIVATINWVVLSGFRAWSVGDDTLAYKLYSFDTVVHRTWHSLWMELYQKYIAHGIGAGSDKIKDPFYLLLVKGFHVVSDDYQMFLLFIAVIFFVPMGFYIYRHSRHACLSFILFSTLFYTFFAITGHRQTIATALVFFGGLPLIKEKRLILFIILVVFSSSIHASTLCFLPFYWISRIPINKWILCGYWAAIVLVFAFHNQFLLLLQSIIGYENYEYLDGSGPSTFMIFLLLLTLFTTVFFRRIISSQNTYIQMSMHAIFLAGLFSPLLLINPACMRVIQYYSLFLLFLIPEYTQALKSGKECTIFYFICSIVLIALLIKSNPEYEFCWN